jgi:hypothetical protein
MWQEQKRRAARAASAALALLLCLTFSQSALAGPPTHLRTPTLDLTGAAPDPGSIHPAQPFNHGCGVAADSKGDIYVASAANGAIDVFNPSHEYLTTIANSNEPCALAVDSKGQLYVSESKTGKVLRYLPNAYPFSGTPTYGAPSTIDPSGIAEGIAVDRHDDRLYVAEGNRISVYRSDGALDTVDEVQSATVSEASGGTYTLEFKGAKTTPLNWNATAAEVEAALKALPTIGAGNVSVAGSPPSYGITFTGTLAATDVEALKADATGLAGGPNKGVSIKETVKGFNGHIGEGSLTNATAVAVYTYVFSVTKAFGGKILEEKGDRYIFAADDGAPDQVMVFSGALTFSGGATTFTSPKLRKTIGGVDQDRNPETPGQAFGFGAAGAYLAVDPGNRNAEEKCTSISEQACTAGHLLVYDDAHNAVDEFEASGEFLDQLTSEALSDAKPTAMTIERSGGPNDGAIYVTSGSGAGSKLLAFGPLAAPSRTQLPELSQNLSGIRAVATDARGYVYAAAGALIHVYGPTGEEIEVGPEGKGIEDTHTQLQDLAVDSTGKVYVLENDEQATYYTPSDYPPVDGSIYTRHEPPIATSAEFLGSTLRAIAVNPGSGLSKDHVFIVVGNAKIREYDSAANGSKLLNAEFAKGLNLGSPRTIAVYGANGNVYASNGASLVSVVNAEGTEILARIKGAGCPNGQMGANPRLAVDQSNGHVLEYDKEATAREYDAAGACVAEFGQFTTNERPYRVAIDNACALHEPPLTEATTPTCKEFDPANGTAYVAYEDSAPGAFDLTAFGPLAYGEAPLAQTGIASGVGGGSATLNGTLNPHGFDLSECKFEYLLDSAYLANDKAFVGATWVPCAESLATIGKGSSPVSVHAELSGLDPDSRYRFRLLAKNKYGDSAGKAWLFGPPLITTEPALPVLYHEATLRAEVDPSGLASEYRFEYGKGAGEYDQSTPTLKLAAGDGPVAVQAPLTGLAEGATYHFRLVVVNEAKEASGPDQSLVTLQRRAEESCPNVEYRSGLSAKLPDCRAYELVTPAETNGLTPEATAVISSGAADAGFNNWLAAPRGATAGQSLAYFTNGTLPGFDRGSGTLDAYHAHRGAGEHPPEGWASELFSPSYRESVPSITNNHSQQGIASDQLYSLWKINPEESFPETLPDAIYLQTHGEAAGSPCNPRPEQERFEYVGCASLGTDPDATGKFASAGGEHVVFGSEEHLEPDAAPQGAEAIYDRAAGKGSAEVVSLRPDGSAFGAGEDATYVGSSEDGSAVLFEVAGALYLHRAGQTTEVGPSPSTFAGISEDGTRVFYAEGDGANPNDLFVFDLETQSSVQIATNSIFLDVSPDGSHAFFSAEEAGKPNLFAWDAQSEASEFVAPLDPQDFASFAGTPDMDLGRWSAAINPGPTSGRAQAPIRSTPDGGVLVFQSHAQLTAYDNEGVGEIYRYDPAAEVGERLTCPSCDPTGAPASADALLADISLKGINKRTMIVNLTDSGQELFFESPDRLLPEDANGLVDVYEWKARGAAGCERDGGCLALISSGQGDASSHLYGMSADGHDVFFRTREKLVGSDVTGSPSIYDARVQGGIPEAAAKEPCQGDACQGQGSTAPALGAPVSDGAGDGSVEDGAKPRCAKGKRRIKGRCTRPHRKRHHHKRHRATHGRGAGR